MKYSIFVAVAATFSVAQAQTWSACNPRFETTCPKNKALACSYTYSYNKNNAAKDFTTSGGGKIHYEDGVAKFRIEKSYDSPTIASDFYIMYGKVDVRMKAAPGAGIVSSVVLQSDTLDEIDWEWLGGHAGEGQSNYFGKGDTTTYDRGAFHNMDHQEFHTYGVEWTEKTLTWLIDGVAVRTLNKNEVKNDLYPQTPMQIKIGSWAGGDPDTNQEGVVQWAGGPTDYKKGPFDMIVESISIVDYSNGNFYTYSDQSGSAKSIKSEGGKISAGPQTNACGAVVEEVEEEEESPVSLPISTPAVTATTATEAEKEEETEVPTETDEEEEEEVATTTTDAPFPTMTAPFGNSTAPFGNSTTTKIAVPTDVTTPVTDEDDEETPVENDDDETTESPSDEDNEETNEDEETGSEEPTTTDAAAFPESTVVTTTLTQVNTITTCLAVTTTGAAGEKVVTSSTATLTRTETFKSVVTVPCETTTITAPGGNVITTVVPGPIPTTTAGVPSVPSTPTGVPSVEKPVEETKPVTEKPVEGTTPGAEKPIVEKPVEGTKPVTEKPVDGTVPGVETPDVPSVETPEVPSVDVPEVETPEVPSVDVPEVETPEVPSVDVPEVETPVDVETPEIPSVETPVEGEVPTEGELPTEEVVDVVVPPTKIQTYTTVTLTTCQTVCGSSSTGLPPSPGALNNSTAPIFNGTNTVPPPVTENVEFETPEEEEQTNVPGTVIEAPLEFDGAATSLKGGLAGVIVAGVLGFLVL